MAPIHDGELLSPFKGGKLFWSPGPRERLIVRNIKTGNRKSPWSRFTLLPNVNGQKYTLGPIFTGREEQGEFIYLSPKRFGSKAPTKCVVIVKDNKFFVSSSSEDCPVFVNDVLVREQTELCFGDRLSLGDKGNVFLFTERELNPDAFTYFDTERGKYTHNNEYVDGVICPLKKPTDQTKRPPLFRGDFIPVANELILAKIFAFLSTNELKEVRLVSKQWNKEAFPILRQRASLVLNLNFNPETGYEGSAESMRLFHYGVEMRSFPLQNWTLSLPPLKGSAADSKLLEDLNHFIIQDRHGVTRSLKRLTLGGNTASRKDYDVRLSLLQVLAPGLEEFTWAGIWNLNTASGQDYPFSEDIQFHKLKVFTLSLTPVEEDEEEYITARDCSGLNWLQALAQALEGVSSIRLECPAPFSLTFLDILSHHKKFKLVPNLKELSLKSVDGPVIRILLNLKIPLKKLEVFSIKLKKVDFHLFDELLENHAKILESLLFIIPSASRKEGETPPIIRFPGFPKLQSLNVGLDRGFGSPVISLIFPDGRHVISYDKDLPSLKYLTLWPVEFGKYPLIEDGCIAAANQDNVWHAVGPLYEMFLPLTENNQIIGSVQFLDILGKVPNYNNNYSPLFSEEKEIIIADMFPNVKNNAWISSIRDGSWRTKCRLEEQKEAKLMQRARKKTDCGQANIRRQDNCKF